MVVFIARRLNVAEKLRPGLVKNAPRRACCMEIEMGQLLREVIDLLYKPPKYQRQVIAVARRVAEQLPQLPNVAMISITAPGRAFANVDGFTHLLRLSFADVDHLNTEVSVRSSTKIKDAFTVQQAEEIHVFVRALPAGIKTIVVHCEGGYSRSAGVVLALHRLYGFAVNATSLLQSNQSVLKIMQASQNQ